MHSVPDSGNGMQATRLVLASGSATRRDMLRAAGVVFDIVPSAVDEPALRTELFARDANMPPAAVARELAEAKAREVSRREPEASVIGSDQVLELDGEILVKPATSEGVRDTLRRLSGRTHVLHAAVAFVRNDSVVWRAVDSARLTMRQLSPSFIEDYLSRTGEAAYASVGAYQVEGLGIQLFDRIDGDHFTILGMPLLPLLHQLRADGVLPA